MYEPPGPTVGHLQLFQKNDKCPPGGGGEEDADVRLELWLTHKA